MQTIVLTWIAVKWDYAEYFYGEKRSIYLSDESAFFLCFYEIKNFETSLFDFGMLILAPNSH